MAHEIFGERFLGRRRPAWHGLGQTFDAPIGALEAIETAGLDYQVSLEPMYFNVPGTRKKISAERNAIVRHPTPDADKFEVLGYAQDTYGLLQNTELGAILDPLTERWPVESVGALKLGKTIFLSLDAGGGEVGGEEVHQYFLFTETKDGLTSAKFAFTPVRVVCQNTLVSGLKQAVVTATLPHHGDFEDDLNWRTSLLYQLQDVQEQVMASFNAMAAQRISAGMAKSIFTAAYPEPQVPQKIAIARALAEEKELAEEGDYIDVEQKEKWLQTTVDRMAGRRGAANELFAKLNDEYPEIANTSWGAYNAVVEVEDFRGKENEGSLSSTLFGSRAQAKKRAFNRALELVK